MNRIRNFLLLMRNQMWLLPLAISGVALLLAYFLLQNGAELLSADYADLWWIYSGDASSARTVFATLLAGMMTMTSLVVSITFVILTLAANQLGPRLISTFIADRQIQAVIGLFLGTILYVLVVLRTLGDELGSGAVPHIAITVGSALTILCLFTLLFYLHKVARAIIADNVVRAVATEFLAHIQSILPEESNGDEAVEVPTLPEVSGLALGRRGYIQTIDYDALIELAEKHSAIFSIDVRAGHFVMSRGSHVRVHPAGALDERGAEALRSAFVIGEERTPAQDLEHGIRQLVEVALRAMSPSINDPFTAIAVIDRLGAGFEEILLRSLPPAVLRDDSSSIRLIVNRSDMAGLFDAAFTLIREAGKNQPAIMIRIADVVASLGPVMQVQESRQAAVDLLNRLSETAQLSELAPRDRDAVLARIQRAMSGVEHMQDP